MNFSRTLHSAVLYAALALGANPGFAAELDRDAMLALRSGDMRKLAIHKTPKPVPTTVFTNPAGDSFDLSAFRGKYVLLNFWATWCAPCRKEMPSLDALQKQLGGEDFQVVLIATGRNPAMAITQFFDEVGIENLETFLDPKQVMAGSMAVFGLPITMIIDPKGNEIARMRGDAEWFSDDAVAFLSAVIAGEQS